jgi:hypothetical protein
MAPRGKGAAGRLSCGGGGSGALGAIVGLYGSESIFAGVSIGFCGGESIGGGAKE